MSVVEFVPPALQSSATVERGADARVRWAISLEQVVYLLIFALSLVSHVWGLGDRALHHDETHHAFFSWQLFMGQGFIHDPLLHGPFLYHFNALIYFLFGDSDFTARLGVALFGSVLVLTPYVMRRELGRTAALLASVYFAISPAFLYVGRFIRHDMYAVVFEVVTFIAVVRYASTRRARWLYVGAAALGLMFTTMESFFLYVAIFGSLLVLIFLWRVWRPGIVVAGLLGVGLVALVFVLPGKPLQAGGDAVQRANGSYVCPSPEVMYPPDNPIQFTPGPIFGFGPLATADNNYALCVRNEPDNNFPVYFVKLGQFFGHPAIVLSLVLMLVGVGVLYVLIWRRRTRDGATVWERARLEHDGLLEAFASLARGRRVVVALAIFGMVYALLFTAFFTNPAGVITGTTGSLLYWLAQHGVQRGGQPGYYYLVLLVIYEPIALLWSVIGLVMMGVLVVRRLRRERVPGDEAPVCLNGQAGVRAIDWSFAMPMVLVWWAIATVLIYSWAGEKMPWLTIHVALPLVLLGAWACGTMIDWWRSADQAFDVVDVPASDGDESVDGVPGLLGGVPRSLVPALPMYLGCFTLIATLGFVLLSIVAKPDGPQRDLTPLVPLLLLALFGLLTVGAGLLRGWRWAIGALALGVTLLGAGYGLRSAYQLSFRWGDVPREMMIYTQTSPDVARVIGRLREASLRRGGAMDLPIWFDNETVWKWYLRRFTNKQEQSVELTMPPGNEVQAVLELQENMDAHPQNAQSLQGFRMQRYPLRWWFPEEAMYRLPVDWLTGPVNDDSPLLMRVLRMPTDGRTAAQVWQFLIYRDLPVPLGSSDFVIAVRPELVDEVDLGAGAPK